MDWYSLLREFADSWMLLALTLVFVGVILFTFRPSAKEQHSEAASIPLREGRDLKADIKDAQIHHGKGVAK